MKDFETLFKVNLKSWIEGAIEKTRQGKPWKCAWIETGISLEVTSSCAEKFCPMAATRTLYELGRIKNSGMPFKEPSLRQVCDYSKNGAYAILALRIIAEEPEISQGDLWKRVKILFEYELGDKPAKTDQGAATIAFKLWKSKLIVTN